MSAGPFPSREAMLAALARGRRWWLAWDGFECIRPGVYLCHRGGRAWRIVPVPALVARLLPG